MFKIKHIGILTLLIIVVNSCKLLNTPPKSPKLINIEWHKSGGMLPSYTNAYISADSCVWENYNGINLQRIVFELSDTEILDLYSTFYNNQFTKIKSSKQDVLDRGGSDIYINVDEKRYELLNSGSNFIIDEYRENYKAIEQVLLQKFEDINSKQNKNVIIDLDESISSSEHNVVLYINNKEVYNEQKTGEFNSLHHTIQNNSVQFKLFLMQKSSSSFQTVLHKYELTLKDNQISKDLILTLVDGKLILK
jgi:hypothetical protein